MEAYQYVQYNPELIILEVATFGSHTYNRSKLEICILMFGSSYDNVAIYYISYIVYLVFECSFQV